MKTRSSARRPLRGAVRRWLALALFAALLPALPSRLCANSVWDAVEAGHLTWSGSGITTNWLASGDLVIKFTDTAAVSTLHLPGFARVWALAVGGGGAGSDCNNLATTGGGGGGGAGGFVETNNFLWAGGDYSITVGAGGEKHTTAASQGTGNAGSPSSVSGSGGDIMVAAGGGGGGFKVVGANGGSGGGAGAASSNPTSGPRRGGYATPAGQGNDGGRGGIVKYGGGGGGAGGPGAESVGTGTPGGLAKSSSITGTEVWYAGGGGGGSKDATSVGLGGGTEDASRKGGGGNGANLTNTAAGDGVDGFGGGGGGAASALPGGGGGAGVVVVRISFVIDGAIEKPKSIKALYTGEEIVACQSIPGVYEVTGTAAATNVSDDPYSYTATLVSGLTWKEGDSDPVTVDWWIVPGTNSIPVPAFTEVPYDEKKHTAAELPAEAKFRFVAGSVTVATNVGAYSYTVELLDKVNWRWADGSITNQTFHWSITPRQIVPQPLPTGLVYSGTNNVAATNSSAYTFVGDSVPCATNAGTYKVVFALADAANNRWPDGSITNLTYSWTIARLPVDYPVPRSTPGEDDWNFLYNGSTQTAATNSAYYSFGGTTISALHRGDYFFTATLNENWCWKDPVAPLAPFSRAWWIKQAPNEITSLSLGDWKLGEPPKTPSITAKFGASTVQYSYGRSPSGSDWSPVPPETNGVFYVKAFIPEEADYGDWSSAVRTKRFLIYKSFEELFTDYVDIDFSGYVGQPVENYRALIRLSPAIYPGFSYERCPDGEGLAFMNMTPNMDQSPLAFDVDTWNPEGESLVWVKIPKLETRDGYAKTKIRMYWHLRDGMESPGSDPAETWSDYTGVWHFNETIASGSAATALSHDSTGHGYDASPMRGDYGDLSQMISMTTGQIGLARRNASTTASTDGNRLIVSNLTDVVIGSGFVFSGWVRFGGFSGSPAIFSRRMRGSDGGFSVGVNNASSRKAFDLYGADDTKVTTAALADGNIANHWEYITYAASGDRYWIWVRSPTNGSGEESGTLHAPIGTEAGVPLAFGNDPTGGVASVCGAFDEFRIRPWNLVTPGTPTAAELAKVTDDTQATFSNEVAATEFVQHGWVVVDDVRQNYWITEPTLSKTSWDVADPPATVSLGEPATGTVFYVCSRQFDEGLALTNALPTAAGRYNITFIVEEDGFNTLTKRLTFSILGHSGRSSVGATEEGRILLANEDSQGDWGETSVTNQAYWRVQYVEEDRSSYTVVTNYNPITHKITTIVTNWFYWTETITNGTYWTHSGVMEKVNQLPYLLPGTLHTLETTNNVKGVCGGSLLWRLNNVRVGNMFAESAVEPIPLNPQANFLPWSPTSCGNSSNGVAFTQKEVGNLMLRNALQTEDGLATGVYSPCYTNGIGTIYFDAVNYNANFSSPLNPDSAANYRLVVEVATNAIGSAAIPTDANVFEIVVTTNEVTEIVTVSTNLYGRADWHRVPIHSQKLVGGVVQSETESDVMELGMTAGGTHANFYRAHVALNRSVPMRFRIRRLSINEAKAEYPDSGGQILMDNIIVSPPRMRADMESYGRLDLEKTGPSVIGFECATSVPYPAITDTDVRGRARPFFSTSGDTGVDTNAFITGVTLHYRWRYLKQQPADLDSWASWSAVDMRRTGGIIEASSPFVFPQAEGDVEYWYETFLQAPFYSYVDYSGMGCGVPGYTEELRCVTNRFSGTAGYAALGGAELPTLGTDWFFRLRNGRDTAGSATLVISEGALAGEYPMYIAEDSTWRCLLAVPKEAAGVCRFYFRVNDRQEPGTTAVARNAAFLSPEADVEAFPVKGRLVDGTVPRSFTIDHAATHLEWRFNDLYATYAVTRAEYQTFNEWSDAHTIENPSTKKADFLANFVDTNGVNVTDMKTYPANIPLWNLYVPTNEVWNETFHLADYNDPGFPKETIFASHATPNGWGADYIAFVSEVLGGTLTTRGDEYLPYPENSGMAGKLIGQGKGRLSFTLSNRPDGLERITYKARIGQAIEFDRFAYTLSEPRKKNYMFTTLATMSHTITDSGREGDMAPGAALSMIGCYRAAKGFYEFRVERIETGDRTMMSIWKWHNVNGAMTAECLVKRRMPAALWTNDTAWENNAHDKDHYGPGNPRFRLMFISVKDTGTGTEIYGGISHDAQIPGKDQSLSYGFNRMAKGYWGLYYNDTTADRHVEGSYGLAAKDCPAVFMMPRHLDTPIEPNLVLDTTKNKEYLVGRADANAKHFIGNNAATNNKDILGGNRSTTELLDDREDIRTGWWELPVNRIEPFTDTSFYADWGATHYGLRMPLDLRQDIIVQIAPSARPNNWETIGTNTVSGYGFTAYELPLYRKGTFNLRFTTGETAVDTVVDDVKQAKWMGEDGTDSGQSITYASDKFIYTQGHVVTNTTAKRIEIELVPSRARAERPLSIRSPQMKGLGKIAFTYDAADTAAEVWVQMATNRVDGNLTGAGGYNESVKSVDFGLQQEVGEWITLRKYTYANADAELRLGPSGKKTVYVGIHDRKGDPLYGIFRLFVPTNIVAATDEMTPKELDEGGRNHGRITITGVTAWDEPALDERSWRGWNMRTAGDDQDVEKRMLLGDMAIAGGSYGLVCALNNSVNDVVTDDAEKVRTAHPTIWSPTLGTYTNAVGAEAQALVGEVTFKARVYGSSVVLAPGRVTLYGSLSSVGDRWEKLEEFTIDTPYFRNYSWKAGADSYAALKFVVDSARATTTTPAEDRVILDEITICERVQPTLSFVYAWPFRDGLNGTEPIANIGAREQQPLAGENWGVQTKLALQQLGDEVDLDRGLEVTLLYFDSGAADRLTQADWGYSNWKDRVTGQVRLEPAGDPEALVFRSGAASPASVLPPVQNAGTVVQFMLKVRYYDKGGYPYEAMMTLWTQPPWYHPVDYNRKFGGFTAYTILDAISPGRAWINEINWNNGSKSVTHTSSKVVNNQFIELCVPSGVDMTGWKVRVTNLSEAQLTLATLGLHGVSARKTTGHAVNGYEFLLIESPETNLAGTFPESDGTWNQDSISTVSGGTLSYANPFAFELVRPSGVVEHTFTIDGTNEWGTIRYDATNLLARLNAADGSPSRFYAGRELEKNDNGSNPATRGTTFGSSGAVGSGGTGPGGEGTWVHGLDFTPAALNPNQTIPEGWFLAPNGTNSWVYFTVIGSHIGQQLGPTATNRTELVILPQGTETNVLYTAEPWYEVSSVAVDGVTNQVYRHRPGTWSYPFTVPEGADTIVRVVATEGIDDRLMADRYGLRGQRYANAVLKWLQARWPDKSPDDIRFARYADLVTFPATRLMTLIEMYWLDIPPFASEGSTFTPTAEMDPLSSEWVLRGGFTDYKPHSVIREKNWGKVTNSVFKVKLMVTNEFDNTASAPGTVQGLDYERSAAGNYTGGWTSVAFRIYGMLDVNRTGGFNQGFKPFREFIFNAGSFGEPGAIGTPTEGNVPGTPGEFETVIELLDPFSKGSIGYEYGWWRHPNTTPAYFKWQIDSTNNTPVTVEMLQKRSTY